MNKISFNLLLIIFFRTQCVVCLQMKLFFGNQSIIFTAMKSLMRRLMQNFKSSSLGF